jgi:nucleoside 2-deoxyribosyltransferase
MEKKRIYEGDIMALKTSDIIVAVLDGVDVDSGVCMRWGTPRRWVSLLSG